MKPILWAGAALGALLVLTILVLPRRRASGPEGPGARPSPAFEVGIPTAQEVRNMLAVYGERVEGAEKEIAALRARLEETQKRLEERHRKDLSSLERWLQDLRGSPSPEPAPPVPAAPRFRTFEFEKRKGRSLHLPAGSFGEALLLTGVFAPVSGEAMPVLLRLEAALIGPGRSRVPLHGAFLIGKAQGETNSRRAIVQLETLSTVRPDGQAVEAKVNGWVVDEDGLQGLRGNYVWRADEVLALGSVTGALSGGAEALSQKETAVQVNPLGTLRAVTGDPMKFAGFHALSTAMGRLSEMVTRRLEEIVPAIHVPNDRRVTVVFIGGTTLEGYDPSFDPVSEAGPEDRK